MDFGVRRKRFTLSSLSCKFISATLSTQEQSGSTRCRDGRRTLGFRTQRLLWDCSPRPKDSLDGRRSSLWVRTTSDTVFVPRTSEPPVTPPPSPCRLVVHNRFPLVLTTIEGLPPTLDHDRRVSPTTQGRSSPRHHGVPVVSYGTGVPEEDRTRDGGLPRTG